MQLLFILRDELLIFHYSFTMKCIFYDSVGAGSRWSLRLPMDFKTHTDWMTQ